MKNSRKYSVYGVLGILGVVGVLSIIGIKNIGQKEIEMTFPAKVTSKCGPASGVFTAQVVTKTKISGKKSIAIAGALKYAEEERKNRVNAILLTGVDRYCEARYEMASGPDNGDVPPFAKEEIHCSEGVDDDCEDEGTPGRWEIETPKCKSDDNPPHSWKGYVGKADCPIDCRWIVECEVKETAEEQDPVPEPESEELCGNGVIDEGEDCDNGKHCAIPEINPSTGESMNFSCVSQDECPGDDNSCEPITANGCKSDCTNMIGITFSRTCYECEGEPPCTSGQQETSTVSQSCSEIDASDPGVTYYDDASTCNEECGDETAPEADEEEE